MAQLNVTDLDFDTIKENLKTFLDSQTEFDSYDFEGSVMSVLLDTLAYNTHYNAVLAHMLANESFLDTAIKRTSVVSLAKALGYTPRSARSSLAQLDLSVVPDSSYTQTSYTLSRDTYFNTTQNGTTYTFYPQSDVTASLTNVDGVSTFVFSNLPIREGSRISNNFIVDANSLSGPFVIPNLNVDTTTLRVRVTTSISDSTVETFTLHNTLLDLTSTSKVYFLEENLDGFYVLRFGDGVLGKQLTSGNIVNIDYLVNANDAPNGANTFTCANTLTGSGETKTITNVVKASGGAEKESIDSIRRTAPRYNATKERAVNASDYKSLILASNAAIQSVSVWGGEENDPPIYGKVFISLDPVPGQIITDAVKDNIKNNIIIPKCPVSILPEFVDPEYMYVGLRVGVVYNPNSTNFTSGQISNVVSTAITDFFNNNLNQLNKNLYYSKIHDAVKASSKAIVSVNITPTIQRRFRPSLGTAASQTINLNSRIQPRELHSTWFDTTISSATYKVKLQDRPNSGVIPPNYNGTGVVFLQDALGKTFGDVGTINYDTGKIQLNSILINSLYGTDTFLKVSSRPHDDSKDILTSILTSNTPSSVSAVYPKPSKNTILTIDDSAQNATTGSRLGINIVVTTDSENN